MYVLKCSSKYIKERIGQIHNYYVLTQSFQSLKNQLRKFDYCN